MEETKELKGLGGWLILVGIGVTLGPLRMIAEFGPVFYAIFTDGTYTALTTPSSEYYNPLWAPLLIFEVIVNTLIVSASLVLVYLFFSKHYFFPKLYIIIISFSLIFIPLDAWLGTFVMVDEPMFDANVIKELGRTAIAAVIWVPYMLISIRVKQTFVEGRNSTDTAPLIIEEAESR